MPATKGGAESPPESETAPMANSNSRRNERPSSPPPVAPVATEQRSVAHAAPPPLPVSVEAWDEALIVKDQRTINDHAQDIHRRLLRGETANQYKAYLLAVYDEQAVEGSLSIDNSKAAEMIRNRATELDANHPLASEKLATIVKALGVVLRRYEQDRRSRRQRLDGEYVHSDENNK